MMILQILLYFAFYFSFITSIYATSFPADSTNCGPNALMAICNNLKVNTTIQSVCELSWYDPETGTTMMGLMHASNELKLPAVPLKMKYDEFRKLNKPGIVFFRGNHFSVAWKLTKDAVVIQYWPSPRFEITRKEFESIWSGEVIVFSKFLRWLKRKELAARFSPLSGPKIIFTLKKIDKGEVVEGTEISHSFSFVNNGSAPLTISSRSNCACTAAVLSEKEIAPGKQGKIKVTFNTSGRTGPQISSVNVVSNDLDNRLTTLSLSCLVKPFVKVLPRMLLIDKVMIGDIIKKEFKVYVPDSTFTITEILVDNDIHVIKRNVKRDKDGVGITFSATMVPHGMIGKYSKSIKLMTNKPNLIINIPVEGEIVGPLEAIPPMAYLGEINPDFDFKCELNLHPRTELFSKQIYNLTVKTNCKGTKTINTFIKESQKQDGQYEVQVIGSISPQSKIIEGTLEFYNGNSEKVLTIPIFGMVKR